MPGPASNPHQLQQLFAYQVAAGTGLDPRVILAQITAEGAPGNGAGYFNYLNIAAPTAAYNKTPYVGVGPANTAIFGTMQAGVAATIAEYKALGITKAAGKPPAEQIDAIANSGWASSHYGTPAGSNLLNDFKSLYPNANVGGAPASGYGAATQGQTTLGQSPIGQVVTVPLSIADFLGRLTNPAYIIRGLELVAGSVLVLLGLWLLVKQVGLAAGIDVPSPVEVASATIPGAPAQKAARAAQTRSTAAAQAVQVRESRSAELHTSRVKLNQARATELRTRTRHRRRTKQEQNKELDRAYIRGAADTSPLGG